MFITLYNPAAFNFLQPNFYNLLQPCCFQPFRTQFLLIMYNPAASNLLYFPSILLQPSFPQPFTNPFYPFVTQLLLNKNILNHLINSEIETLVNSLKLIGNPDGPGASAPDLSPVQVYRFFRYSIEIKD